MNDVRVPAAVDALPGKEEPSFPASPVGVQAPGSPPAKRQKKKKFMDEATGVCLVTTLRTIQCKVKPCSVDWLNQAAQEVNQVWNFCNDLTARSARPFYGTPTHWSAFDMNRMLVGCGDVFTRIGSAIAQRVAAEHATRRKQFKTAKLRFRASGGRKKSLGWVPFKVENLRFSEILVPRAEPISPPLSRDLHEKRESINNIAMLQHRKAPSIARVDTA